MSASMHLLGRLQIECDDEEPTLWIRGLYLVASVALTPRNIEQIEAACAEARKYHAMEKVA